MFEDEMTFAELIKRIREKLGKREGLGNEISQEVLAARLGVSRRTISRWENGFTSPATLELCVKIANVAGISVQKIASILGQSEYSPPIVETVPITTSLRVQPLAVWPTNNPNIKRAVKCALEARSIARFEGNLSRAARFYTYAVEAAKKASAELLECYLLGYLGNMYEMLGGTYLDEATKVLDRGELLAEKVKTIAKRNSDDTVVLIAMRLLLTIQLRKGWVLWAKNFYLDAIALAESLKQPFSDLRMISRRINLLLLLARSYAGLGQFAAARMNLDEALAFAYALPHMRSDEHNFFLEIDGGHNWAVNTVITAKIDIFIAEDAIDEAFEDYQKITQHLSPAAALSTHNWFRYSWQKRLQEEITKGTISEEIDEKLGLDFDEWDILMAEGGDDHIRARLAYSQGDYELASGNVTEAIIYYEKSSVLAHEAKAEAVEILSVLACANAYLRLEDKVKAKAQAIALVSSIERSLHRLNNSMLRDIFFQTQETIQKH